MRNGCVFERPTWERRIVATDGSVSRGSAEWSTPLAMNRRRASMTHRSLEVESAMWPHPPLTAVSHGGNWRRKLKLRPVWPTPTLDDVNNVTRRSGQQKSPTRDAKHALATDWELWRDPEFDLLHIRVARLFPTPVSRDWKGANTREHFAEDSNKRHLDQLPNFIRHSEYSPQRLPNSTNGSESSKSSRTSSRRLNPAFDAWLMGFPWWWTRPEPLRFAPAEMRSYLSKLRSLCESFFADRGSSLNTTEDNDQ